MTHPATALQQAVFAALAADAGLAALVGDRIFDAVPRAATFPFVSFGAATAADWSTGTDTGSEHRLTVNIWSRAGGRQESWAIGARIDAALHDQPLALEDHGLVNLRRELAEVRLDPDGLTWHGVFRFRAVTEPA